MVEKTIKFPKKIVEHYLDNLKMQINLQAALLFGSFAWGNPTKHSDVDLVIISPSFKRKSFNRRLDILTNARDKASCQVAMDVVGYTPEEFADIENHSAIMAKAKKQGKWILAPSF
ncbi:MAG: nucleotidyltransferase domain-containing protein [bacterium]|nr:nucleotidyltransferase domain-containing protein [bacterium]